jgi:ankyrin repeat protein
MDYLCECTSDRDRREALKQLPPDLPSSYERILDRVNRSNKQNQRLVKHALHWIAYAGRPLTTVELLQALVIRAGDTSFESSAMTTEDELLHWCSSLVRKNRTCTALELAHFTVKEFLITIDPVIKPSFIDYQLSGDHSFLAEACIAFLTCKSFEHQGRVSDLPAAHREGDEDRDNFFKNFPFITYASCYWDDHVHLSRRPAVQETVMDLFIPKDRYTFQFWTSEFLLHKRVGVEDVLNDESDEPSALHWAACLGLPSVCSNLIENGMDVNKQSKFGRPLNCVILSYWVMDTEPNLLELVCSDAKSSFARKSILQMMLGAGANINTEVGTGKYATCTAFQLALEAEKHSDHPYALGALLDAGCSVSSNDFAIVISQLKEGEDTTWEDHTYLNNLVEFVEGIARNFENYSRSSICLEFFEFVMQMLFCGCTASYLPTFFKIKFENCFPGPGGKRLQRLITEEEQKGERKLIKVLSEAIRMTSDSAGGAIEILQESLTHAVENYKAEIVSILLEVNHDIEPSNRPNSASFEGKSYLQWIALTMLDYACDREQALDVLEALVNNGANVSTVDVDDLVVWKVVIEEGDLDFFKLFWAPSKAIKHYNSTGTNTTSENIKKLLNCAICSKNIPVAEFLLAESHDGALLSKFEWLDFAMSQNNSKILSFLLEQSGTFQREDINRQLALHTLAKSHMSLENFQFLTNQGASTSLQDRNGNTPSHLLSQSHEQVSLEKLRCLSVSNADLNLLNSRGLTPLALAVICKNNPAVQLLLDSGADPEKALAGQQTALHLACLVGNTEAAKALLDHGCNPNPEDSSGSKPIDIALTCGYSELASLFQSATDKHSHNSSGERAQGSHDIEMSEPLKDCHGELPLRTVEPLGSEASPLPLLKRKNPATNFEAPTSMPGKRPRANPA